MTIIYFITNIIINRKAMVNKLKLNFEVCYFDDYRLFLDACKNDVPRLIFIDYFISNIDSFQLLIYLKRNKNFYTIPVVMFGSEPTENLYAKALEFGVDDYFYEDENALRISYKVNVLLRNALPKFKRCKDLYLDLNDLAVYVKNEKISLTYKEYRMLDYFFYKYNKLVTRAEITNYIWKGIIGSSRTLDMHIAALRSKVFLKSELNLVTIIKVGFRLV